MVHGKYAHSGGEPQEHEEQSEELQRRKATLYQYLMESCDEAYLQETLGVTDAETLQLSAFEPWIPMSSTEDFEAQVEIAFDAEGDANVFMTGSIMHDAKNSDILTMFQVPGGTIG